MDKIPKIITKKQAIAYSVIAFNNFLDSGNTSNFDIATIQVFMDGAMGVHKKNEVVKYSEELIKKNKNKMMIKIYEK